MSVLVTCRLKYVKSQHWVEYTLVLASCLRGIDVVLLRQSKGFGNLLDGKCAKGFECGHSCSVLIIIILIYLDVMKRIHNFVPEISFA